ncbi:hypothetical protein D9758_006425 [Tetrapyrgos nigripes]|uniref:Uncharacterized protein n=1 Tax=Tetrapyrgos nigripes TaxID=182062 RepID=A0A8H5G0D2_9AGAR|nr:hypothetical protein D9758_006425 [Tetrapyrgos nigripes]
MTPAARKHDSAARNELGSSRAITAEAFLRISRNPWQIIRHPKESRTTEEGKAFSLTRFPTELLMLIAEMAVLHGVVTIQVPSNSSQSDRPMVAKTQPTIYYLSMVCHLLRHICNGFLFQRIQFQPPEHITDSSVTELKEKIARRFHRPAVPNVADEIKIPIRLTIRQLCFIPPGDLPVFGTSPLQLTENLIGMCPRLERVFVPGMLKLSTFDPRSVLEAVNNHPSADLLLVFTDMDISGFPRWLDLKPLFRVLLPSFATGDHRMESARLRPRVQQGLRAHKLEHHSSDKEGMHLTYPDLRVMSASLQYLTGIGIHTFISRHPLLEEIELKTYRKIRYSSPIHSADSCHYLTPVKLSDYGQPWLVAVPRVLKLFSGFPFHMWTSRRTSHSCNIEALTTVVRQNGVWGSKRFIYTIVCNWLEEDVALIAKFLRARLPAQVRRLILSTWVGRGHHISSNLRSLSLFAKMYKNLSVVLAFLFLNAVTSTYIPRAPAGTQFITGPCQSDADCASACCGFNSGKCAGPVVAQERDGGCGFGDAQPNNNAAVALGSTAAAPGVNNNGGAASQTAGANNAGNGAAAGGSATSPAQPAGTQFITGACTSDADCGSGCCGFNSGKCAGAVVAQERDGGCGFGDAQPNNNAALALGSTAAAPGVKNNGGAASPTTGANNAGNGAAAGAAGASATSPAQPAGTQFITGACTSDADCASGCCGFNSGKCAGAVVAQERDGGCGFGDAQPNNNAALALGSTAAAPGVNNNGGAASPTAAAGSGSNNSGNGAAAGSTGSGKPPGTQFITGPCANDGECASACCGFNSGKCAGPVVAQERDGGCGFGDAQPNDNAAQALSQRGLKVLPL